jgi:hypothetical protein
MFDIDPRGERPADRFTMAVDECGADVMLAAIMREWPANYGDGLTGAESARYFGSDTSEHGGPGLPPEQCRKATRTVECGPEDFRAHVAGAIRECGVCGPWRCDHAFVIDGAGEDAEPVASSTLGAADEASWKRVSLESDVAVSGTFRFIRWRRGGNREVERSGRGLGEDIVAGKKTSTTIRRGLDA